MEMFKPNFTKLQNQAFRLMCVFAGKKLSLSEIANELKVSSTAVSKAVPLLASLGLINIEKQNRINLTLVSLNRNNRLVFQFKRAENLWQVYECGLADALEDCFRGAAIILFGSYSRGDDIYDSDVDIAVIGRKEKEIFLEKFEKALKRKININFYSSFKEIHANLKNNILNGIVLSGSVEL